MLIKGHISVKEIEGSEVLQIEGRELGIQSGSFAGGGTLKCWADFNGNSVEIEVGIGKNGSWHHEPIVISEYAEYSGDTLEFDAPDDLYSDEELDEMEGDSYDSFDD